MTGLPQSEYVAGTIAWAIRAWKGSASSTATAWPAPSWVISQGMHAVGEDARDQARWHLVKGAERHRP